MRPVSPQEFDDAAARAKGNKGSPETQAVLALTVGSAIALEHSCTDWTSCGFATNLYKVARRHGLRLQMVHQAGELFVKRVE